MSRILRIGEFYHQNESNDDNTEDLVVAVAGADLVIPVTHAHVQKTTGGVEALTLANGKPGQLLSIILAATGGDGTLTPATSTGWNTIVFAEVGDQAVLFYVNDYGGWRIWSLTGLTGPPAHT